jgi:hypothetical protein
MNAITRETAVAQIRRQLIAMREEGKSVCQMAAEKGILCRGFSRDTDEELRRRYAAAIPAGANLARRELETRANSWQLERQKDIGTLLCCDVQYMFYKTCRAWDDFSNDDLARFCHELLGEQVQVMGEKSPAVL